MLVLTHTDTHTPTFYFSTNSSSTMFCSEHRKRIDNSEFNVIISSMHTFSILCPDIHDFLCSIPKTLAQRTSHYCNATICPHCASAFVCVCCVCTRVCATPKSTLDRNMATNAPQPTNKPLAPTPKNHSHHPHHNPTTSRFTIKRPPPTHAHTTTLYCYNAAQTSAV